MKLKLYSEYKDSGIQWIGEIPEGWEARKIKHLCFKGAEYGLNEPSDNYVDGGVRFLRITDITENGNLIENGVYLPENKTNKKYLLNTGDVLVARSGSIGTSLYFDRKKYGRCLFAGYLVRFVVNKSNNGRFLYYFTNSKSFYAQIELETIQTTIGNYNGQKYANMEITVPPFQEQTAIANFLDKKTARIDVLIEKDKKLIELLKEKRTALINHAVTKGLPVRARRTQTGLDPNVKLKDSGIPWIGEIPERWEEVPLKKYLESFVDYRGATPEKTDEGIFLVTGKNIKEGKIDYELSKEYVFEDQYEEVMHRGKPKIGDLLFTTEAPLGEVANVDYEKIALAQRIIKIRGKKQKLDDYYLKYYIMTQLFKSHLQSLATGSTALGLKASNWCFLRLIVPPLPEQQKIVEYLDKATSKIDITIQKIEQKITFLEEYKKSLIHYVVTGKVDVRRAN